MSTQKQSDFDIASLLDGTLDDLADLPEFKPFPNGAHKVKLKLEKDAKNKTVYFANMSYVEVMELSDASAEVPAADTETKVRYDMANEYGQGAFKKAFGPVGKAMNLSRMGDIIEAFRNPVDCAVVTEQTIDKKNNRVYTNIVEIGLL